MDYLNELLEIFKVSGASEMEFKFKGVRVRFAGVLSAPEPEEESKEVEEEVVYATAPRVGIFHDRLSSEDEPEVQAGDLVEEGATLGYIYTMGIENKVTSPCDARVLEILVEPGQPVEYAQPLFKLKPIKR